jgi:hypothetical protein
VVKYKRYSIKQIQNRITMTHKEQIIEILQSKTVIDNLGNLLVTDNYNEIADAILSLPIDVPSEEEIENKFPYAVSYANMCSQTGAKWAIEEIIERNKK